ncbi:MAG TPA: hypothetical protein VN419_03090, partial [Humidesulfovibrio sp.]|nr:hypothetical protein [Humidesulfovibrio sp.]
MNKATITRRPGVRFTAARLLAAAFTLAVLTGLGCSSLTLPNPSKQPQETLSEQSTQDLATEADGYWKAGNNPLSELLYSRLLERTDLERAEKLQALDRLAASAYKARHFYQAKQALDRRAATDKTVLAAWTWHELYIRTLAALNRQDLLDTHQAWIMAHPELPFEVRARAVVLFSEFGARAGDDARTLDSLAE